MSNYTVNAALQGRVALGAGTLTRQLAGGVRPQSAWRNPYWSTTPDWARKVFDNLAEFLSRPTFWNGILVGEGAAPSVDPETGIISVPRVTPIDADGVNQGKGISLQSDDWNPFSPARGWRLDKGTGDASFDWLYANVINSRSDHIRFQFQGTKQNGWDDSAGNDFGGSVSINRYGALSAPIVVTANVISQLEGENFYRDLWLNGAVRVDGTGIVRAPDMYARGEQVSVISHTHASTEAAAAAAAVATHVAQSDPHTQYMNTTRGDARYYTQTAADARYAAAGSGVTDHGALTGLADDDHPQYHNNSRGDARYSLLSHTHSSITGTAQAYGNSVSFQTPNTDGQVTFNHGASFTPTWAVVNFDGRESLTGHWGGSLGNISVHEITSSTITLRMHRSDTGAPVTPSYLSSGGYSYVAFYFTCG